MLEVGDFGVIEIILISPFSDDSDKLGEEIGVFVPLEHILVRPVLRIGLGEDPFGGGEEGSDMLG